MAAINLETGDYLPRFGLNREPFGNAPDRLFYWPGAPFEEAFARLLFAVERRRGLALCTGPVGHGKTTLARRLYDALTEDAYQKGLLVVIHSNVTADWLLQKIAHLLGLTDAPVDKLEVLGRIYARLRRINESGRTAVILVDEAQMLSSRELMEEFRGLLNIEVQGRKLINFVFFGLPETEDVLALDPALENRVAVRVRLRPFDELDTREYVAHRLRKAGGDPKLIPDEPMARIHKASGGAPRLINTLCDNLLLEGFLTGSSVLVADQVDKVARDLGLNSRRGVLDEILGAGADEFGKWDSAEGASLDELLGFLKT